MRLTCGHVRACADPVPGIQRRAAAHAGRPAGRLQAADRGLLAQRAQRAAHICRRARAPAQPLPKTLWHLSSALLTGGVTFLKRRPFYEECGSSYQER